MAQELRRRMRASESEASQISYDTQPRREGAARQEQTMRNMPPGPASLCLVLLLLLSGKRWLSFCRRRPTECTTNKTAPPTNADATRSVRRNKFHAEAGNKRGETKKMADFLTNLEFYAPLPVSLYLRPLLLGGSRFSLLVSPWRGSVVPQLANIAKLA